jgi:integrase
MKVSSPMTDKVPQPKRRAHRTGTVVSFRNGDRTVWAARILLKDGSRKQLRCPVGITRKQAEKLAAEWQAREDATHALYNVRARGQGAPVDGEVAGAWFARMLPIRQAAMQTGDSVDLASTWRVWIAPHIGEVPMVAISRSHIVTISKALDQARIDGRLAPKSAINAWSCLRSAFRIACSNKGWAEAVRVRDDDPTQGVEPPDNGESKKRQWLYPAEFAKVMACTAIPIERKRMWAFLAYSGLRPGEAAEIRYKDIEREQGILRVSRAYNVNLRVTGLTKTLSGERAVPIERALLPILGEGEPDELLFAELRRKNFGPNEFRDDLLMAGVNSPRLWLETATHLRVDLRCLRDTYASWQCLAGLDVHKLMRRMGHAKIDQTIHYAKVAEAFQNVGEVFPALPWSGVTRRVTESTFHEENQCEGRELNPYTLSGART